MSLRITGALLFCASVAFSVIATNVSRSASLNGKKSNSAKSTDATSLASKEEQSISTAKPLSCKATQIESATITTVVIVEERAKNVVAEPVVNIMSEISIEEPVKKTDKAVSSTKKISNAVAPAPPKATVKFSAPAFVQRPPEASFSGSASVDLSATIDVEDDAPW